MTSSIGWRRFGAGVAVVRSALALPLERTGVVSKNGGKEPGRPAIWPTDRGALVVWPGKLALMTPDLKQELWSTEITAVSAFAVEGEHVWYPETYGSRQPSVRVFDLASGEQKAAFALECAGGLRAFVPETGLGIFAGHERRELVACDIETGKERWSLPFSTWSAVDTGRVIVATASDLASVIGIDCATARELWRFDVPRAHEYSSLSPTENLTVFPDGQIIAAMDDGPLFRLDAMTGAVVARRDAQGRPGAIDVTPT